MKKLKIRSTTMEELRQSFYSGNFRKSEHLALDYIKTNGKSASAYMNLYFIYIALGLSEKSKEAFQQAQEIDPEAYYKSFEDSILKFDEDQSGLTQKEMTTLLDIFDKS
ncbi:MAG: hypothetical protein ACQETH_11185 [Candidatus Rifleibacteriota bacterium]